MEKNTEKLDKNKKTEEQLESFHNTYEKITKTNIELAEHICQLKREVEYYKEQAKESANKEIHLRREIVKAEQKIYSSIRYQAGNALFNALHPSKNTFKLPVTLIQLWKKSRTAKVVKPISQPASAIPYSNEGYQVEKERIIKSNKEYLMSNGKSDDVGLVSIIIVNRNGLHNLEILFESLLKRNYYQKVEFIIVDNNSEDDSVDFLYSLKEHFKIQVITNSENRNFSEANNQGSRLAQGEYLLFLNNDTEVTDYWLDELLYVLNKQENAGAVGAKLVYPYIPDESINSGKTLKIQHAGIGFRKVNMLNKPFIQPYNLQNGKDVFQENETVQQKAAITAAALLVRRDIYNQVGGFDEEYNYGYEDVDLCLKIHRAGYKNYYCPSALLFHYEFGTQSKDNQNIVKTRRIGNINLFKKRWINYLSNEILQDKLNHKCIFTECPLTIAFAVTEAGEQATAGDYFTALEFASAMEKKGIITKYLCRRGNQNWYDVGYDVDILIAMIDAYDVTKMKNCPDGIITIAWMRNQFERWCRQTYFYNYCLIFASSKIACDFVTETTGRTAELFPIATNADRFLNMISKEEDKEEQELYGSDYVFTGSYWNVEREIMNIIHPDEIPYRFKVFGANWEKADCFSASSGGFIKYDNIPLIYKYTKVVIDDANNVTKEFGSVNSRVFDALASGKLVLTNGKKGALDTFNGELPYYEDNESFKRLLSFYIKNEEKYQEKVSKLQNFVLKNHTYDIRVNRLIDILKCMHSYAKKQIAIMMPVPSENVAYAWGDYHFAVSMKKYLERLNYKVELRYLDEWYKPYTGKNIIVLRGLTEYIPKNEHLNIMWNISHPDMVSENEYKRYDKVYIASELWAENLKEILGDKVEPLLQCTDAEQFHCDYNAPKKHELLFIGNSRFVFRKILKDVLPTSYDLSVFGENWEGIIDSKYIKGNHIPNDKLYSMYGSAKILLNDHWDDMRENGFISNRIFDGLASGAFIISDNVYGLKNALQNYVITYETADELKEKISFYLQNPQKALEIASHGHNLVLKKHTMLQRINTISEYIMKQLPDEK